TNHYWLWQAGGFVLNLIFKILPTPPFSKEGFGRELSRTETSFVIQGNHPCYPCRKNRLFL
ncbi:MAG: hypothetical protein COY85_04625, partial [Candidatus Portnoybacteria bacterium CG_4_10_14_0_8_um_filter_40_50]